MKVSRNSDIYYENRKEYYQLLKKAGWDAVDLNEFQVPQFYNDNFSAQVRHGKEILKTVKNAGLEIGQCHAPMQGDYFKNTPEKTESQIKVIGAAIKLASELEIPNVVVHPYVYSWSEPDPDEEYTYKYNAEYLSRIMEFAGNTNVCLENMPGPRGFINSGKKCKKLLDMVGDDRLCICFDTGHLFSVGGLASEFFQYVGDRIKVTHIHDSVLNADRHMLPYTGVGDWNDFKLTIQKFKYSGTMNSESKFSSCLPVEDLLTWETTEAKVIKSLFY